MTDDQQADLRWAPNDPAPTSRWRIWLIVGLIAAGLAVAVVLVLLLLPRDGSPAPEGSPSASPSATATATPTAEPTTEPEPSMTPVTTPPPPVDPTVEAFRSQVTGYLDDALTGLDIVSETSGAEASAVVDTLEADLQRLSESAAPSSISARWGDGLADYAVELADLRDAISGDRSLSAAVDSTRDSVGALRDIVGL
ncbi:hypothetical protein [Microbacterium sp. H83]|uniref:hypothetical protein n=1 Tax=Microbacterium sp. H83 TaxID=1827324 RepID=UPI0007F3F5A8|nr:hypothetical protein [Microbacterium sp. H83]OAN41268.1 hypothetical protein A4X16_11340 [Microbacterium sp. H83]